MPTTAAPMSRRQENSDVLSRFNLVAEQAILFLSCATLGFAVLAFGATQEWAVCALECGAAVLFALWAWYQLSLQRIRLTSPALIPALLLLSLPLLQLCTGRTAYAYATRYELMKWIAYGVFFLIASELSSNPSARKFLAIAITVFGSLYALFSMIQGFTCPADLLYGFVKTHGSGFGSYTNRNHYAGLMEMVLPFGLVTSSFLFAPNALRGLSIFGSLVMLTSIFASGSRGGMISAAVALCIFIYYQVRRRSARTRVRVILLAVLACGFITFFAYDRVKTRSVVEATDSMRLQIARDSIQLVAKHPILGSGLGTFPTVYPEVRTFPTDLFVNAAHNDYVQLIVETGLLGMLFAAAFLALVFRNVSLHLRRTQTDWFSAVSLAAMIGSIALLIHSFVDFNLQIPANAATFTFLLGLASARPREDERINARSARESDG
jgi:O-antigen ligase